MHRCLNKVFDDRHVRKEVELLKDHAHALPHMIYVCLLVAEIHALKENLTGTRFFEAV